MEPPFAFSFLCALPGNSNPSAGRLLELLYDRSLVDYPRSPRGACRWILPAFRSRRGGACKRQPERRPQHLPLAGCGLDPRGSSPRRGDAALERRPVRRRPFRAVGPARLGQGLLRSRRFPHHVRRALLPRSKRHGEERLLAGGTTARRRSSHRGKNSPSSAGVRNHRRESGVRRLRPTS